MRLGGQIDRPLSGQAWLVPEAIELADDRLVWILMLTERGASEAAPRPGLLDDFLKLTDARPETILAFAKQWGILGICHHGLPSMHLQNPLPLAHGPEDVVTDARGLLHVSRHVNLCYPSEDRTRDEGGWYWEPLDAWRRYARQMTAALNIASAIKAGGVGKAKDWEMLFEGPRPIPDSIPPKAALTGMLNFWMSVGLVRLRMVWRGPRPAFDYAFAGVFGALTLQLVQAISSEGDQDGLATCSTCQRPYTPKRWPRGDQKHYCDACRARAGSRNSSQNYRDKIKARKLHAEGLAIDEIADRLAQDTSWVTAILNAAGGRGSRTPAKRAARRRS